MRLDQLIGDETKFPMQHRILNTVLLFGMALAVLSGVANYVLNLGALMVLLSAAGLVIVLTLYYLSRIKKQYSVSVFFLIFLFVFIFTPVMWIHNSGITGATAYFIVIFGSMIATLLRGLRRIITLGCLVSITMLLLFFEYNNPALIVGYNSDIDRFSDVAFTLLITLVANASLYMVIINHYIKEHKRARDYLEQIEQQRLKIEIQEHLKSVNKMLEQEIDERRQVEQELRLSEERFAKAFRSSPVPMCILTLSDGRFIDVNESFINAFEFERRQIIGKTPEGLAIWTNQEDFQRKVLADKAFYNLEIAFRTSSGDKRAGLYSAELIEVSGELCLLGVIHDLTERLRLEKEMARLDRLNLVGEMAASLGHEIRNPLTTVRGFLQLLQKSDVQKRDYFNLMIDELDRANGIITEFLSLAKNKALDLQAKSLNTILLNLFPLMQADALKTGNEIELELGEIPELLLDEKEIRQLILNLVRNGLEAMQSGGKLTIATACEGGDVILSVRDEGTGIAASVIEKLGTPFFTTKDNGNGLGLAVCYSIAARHNARISVETSSAGTTFYVKIDKAA
jgi:two-component system, sporulation sensor kinase E